MLGCCCHLSLKANPHENAVLLCSPKRSQCSFCENWRQKRQAHLQLLLATERGEGEDGGDNVRLVWGDNRSHSSHCRYLFCWESIACVDTAVSSVLETPKGNMSSGLHVHRSLISYWLSNVMVGLTPKSLGFPVSKTENELFSSWGPKKCRL